MTAGIIIAAIAVVAILGILLINALNTRAMKSQVFEKTCEIVNKHIVALSRRRVQLIRKDPYGTLIFDDWIKEANYFIKTKVLPVLSPQSIKKFQINDPRSGMARKLTLTVVQLTAKYCDRNPVYLAFKDDMTPSEFEDFCAEVLRSDGWDARVTMRSRDQGVDVVAEKHNVKVVVQCKLYARPVGNKAVQEVVAGRSYEGANYGIVVSNNRFTPSAEQLAKANNVILFHYTDLQNLDSYIFGSIERDGMPAADSTSDEDDPLYDEAVRIVTETQRASISSVQRRLRIGYNRAARLVEQMERVGIVGPLQSNGSREVLAGPPPE